MANNEESVYDATLCNKVTKGSAKLGPYTSTGPRMVVVFGSLVSVMPQVTHQGPFGFKARVEFKTGKFEKFISCIIFIVFADFGVPGGKLSFHYNI